MEFQHQAYVMGPSKATVSDDTFAFATQLYRNEAKALQTQVLFDFCSNAELAFICDCYKKMTMAN